MRKWKFQLLLLLLLNVIRLALSCFLVEHLDFLRWFVVMRIIAVIEFVVVRQVSLSALLLQLRMM